MQVVTYTYDGLQRLDLVKARSVGDVTGITTDYDYLVGGPNEVLSTITYSDDLSSSTISKNTFDGFGRPLDSYLNDELKQGRKYDRYGRASQQTFIPGRWMRLSYDSSPLRRVRRERYPDGSQIRYRYLVQGGIGGVERSDEKRNKTITLTDVFGRTSAMIDPEGGTTGYTYTNWDAPAIIQPPQGSPFVYTYHPTRKLESKTIPGGGTTTYSYDDHHRLSATMTPRGEVIGNVYDPYGRIKETHFGGGLPSLGQDYDVNSAEYLLSSVQYYPNDGGQAGRVHLMETRLLQEADATVSTNYTYDEYGRLLTQVEDLTLDDDIYTLTTNIPLASYTHRDLPTNNSFQVERNGHTYELTSEMSYDVFGRAEKEDYNFKVNGVTQLEEPNWHAEFTYNAFDQMTNKRFWKKPGGGWYGEKYSYNGRGWLTQINSPSSRGFDVEYCEQPTGNVYQGSSEEAEVTFEQLLQYMLDGEAVTLVDYNNCPDDDGVLVPDIPDVPYQGDCITSVSDYYTNFDPGNNLYASKDQKEKEKGQNADDYQMIALMITGGEYYDGGVEKEFTFSNPIEFSSINVANWEVDEQTLKGSLAQLDLEVNKLYQQQNVLQPEITVTYEDGVLDLHINKSSYNFAELSIKQVWQGVDGNLDALGDNIIVPTTRTLDSGNTRNIRCQNLWSTGLDIKDNWTFPVKLYEVFSETKKDGGKQFVTEAGLAGISGNYDIGKQFYIPNADQVFEVILKSGAEDVISYTELRESLEAELITELDMPKDVKGNTLVSPTDVEPCLTGFINPSCSASEQEAQLDEVQQMLADIDPQTLSYPVTMSYITLCNGQNVLLLGTESELENQLPGDFHFLDQVEVTSADQLFNIRISVPDAIFSASMDHEKNGNIAELSWKTTFHKTRGYEFSYDPLNRLTGAVYEARGYTGEGFTADNFTYDGIGNILSLRRYAQLIPGEDAVLIDDLRYKYHDGLQPGATFPLGSDEDVSRLLSVLELGTTDEALQNGFKPGEATANAAYGYDGSGNMSSDPYKGFGAVYNHLNLPKEIGGDKLIYDASGKKWRVEKEDGKIYHYIGPMTFVDDEFEAANLSDGRIYNAEVGNQSIDLVAEYYSKDHLGNVRAAFTDRNRDGLVQLLATPSGPAEINQTIDYYPFGLQYPGQDCRPVIEPENRYQYNGKEFIKETGLIDYGARLYDPAIGRWNAVDPLAGKYASINPYSYVANMPTIAIDPNGQEIIIVLNNNFGQTMKDLAIINSTRLGRQAISRLARSKTVYKIDGSASRHRFGSSLIHGTRYNNFTNNLTYSQENNVMIDGVPTRSYYTLGHELYHAYQDEIGRNLGSRGREIEAVRFENYMRDVFGSGLRRRKYSTPDGIISIPGDLALDKRNEERVDPNSVSWFTIEVLSGTNQASPEGEGNTMPRDNVNNGTNIYSIVNHVIQYLNESGVQTVHLDFR
ncbi:MAG: RHS repeat-associated core domain-containing protein [Lewinella sp.]